jgi:RNA polymerase sigma factor (sigma-70 family)
LSWPLLTLPARCGSRAIRCAIRIAFSLIALETLSPRQRMVFTLKHYEGYKLREIAVMMKCSEGTVKKYLFEAIARMRKHLKDYVS